MPQATGWLGGGRTYSRGVALRDDVEVEFFRAGGPGGQHRNKTETGVRLRHEPSGVTVAATERRSQSRNRELAFERLIERLEQLNHVPEERVPTRKPRSADRRRLEDKRRRRLTKDRRRKPSDED